MGRRNEVRVVHEASPIPMIPMHDLFAPAHVHAGTTSGLVMKPHEVAFAEARRS